MRLKFEDCIGDINDSLNRQRKKWTLTAIQWMDYDDVCQIIRLHIYKKWKMWDQKRPIKPWLNTIITNQRINLIRNIYGNFSRPCLKCAAAEDSNLCSIYTTQCSKCPLYNNWLKNKKPAYDIKIPVALEFHGNDLIDSPAEVDIDGGISKMHEYMLSNAALTKKENKIYQFLYIDGMKEEQVVKKLGYKINKVTKNDAIKEIKEISGKLYQMAKSFLISGEVEI